MHSPVHNRGVRDCIIKRWLGWIWWIEPLPASLTSLPSLTTTEVHGPWWAKSMHQLSQPFLPTDISNSNKLASLEATLVRILTDPPSHWHWVKCRATSWAKTSFPFGKNVTVHHPKWTKLNSKRDRSDYHHHQPQSQLPIEWTTVTTISVWQTESWLSDIELIQNFITWATNDGSSSIAFHLLPCFSICRENPVSSRRMNFLKGGLAYFYMLKLYLTTNYP